MDPNNPGVQIIHRRKSKSLRDHKKKLRKRRQAIELLIVHTQADHRMDQCWLQTAVGAALYALNCATGYNIRRLLRATYRLGLGRILPCRPEPWTSFSPLRRHEGAVMSRSDVLPAASSSKMYCIGVARPMAALAVVPWTLPNQCPLGSSVLKPPLYCARTLIADIGAHI